MPTLLKNQSVTSPCWIVTFAPVCTRSADIASFYLTTLQRYAHIAKDINMLHIWHAVW